MNDFFWSGLKISEKNLRLNDFFWSGLKISEKNLRFM